MFEEGRSLRVFHFIQQGTILLNLIHHLRQKESGIRERQISFKWDATLKYSRTPLTRTPKGNEKWFELMGVRINRSWCQILFIMLIINKV